jgi:hypothetical protein
MVTTGKYGIFTPSALKDPGGGFFHPVWMSLIGQRRGVGLPIIFSNIQIHRAFNTGIAVQPSV